MNFPQVPLIGGFDAEKIGYQAEWDASGEREKGSALPEA